jgi:hypothetical protein
VCASDWARTETYDGSMEVLKAHSACGIGVRRAKMILDEHDGEAGSDRQGHKSNRTGFHHSLATRISP